MRRKRNPVQQLTLRELSALLRQGGYANKHVQMAIKELEKLGTYVIKHGPNTSREKS